MLNNFNFIIQHIDNNTQFTEIITEKMEKAQLFSTARTKVTHTAGYLLNAHDEYGKLTTISSNLWGERVEKRPLISQKPGKMTVYFAVWYFTKEVVSEAW